jgi:hypothetical protein
MSKFKRGEQVRARTSNIGEVVRRVWDEVDATVYLCSERQYDALLNGWNAPMPIGFPKQDVRKK